MKFPTYKTEGEIPDGFRDIYEEQDGEWVAVLDPDDGGAGGDGPTQDDVDTLAEALSKERRLRRDAETKHRETETRLAELEQARKADAAGLSEDKLKQLRADVRTDIEKEYANKPLAELPETWKAREEGLGAFSEARSMKLDGAVKAKAAKHGVRAERLEAWWRQFGDRFDLTEDGTPMIKDHPGTEVKDFIEGPLKDEMPEFYTGTQASGGGTGGIVKDGKPVAGTDADSILKNPGEALTRAREAEKGS